MKIILATKSERRINAYNKLKLPYPYETIESNIGFTESFNSPQLLTVLLAQAKVIKLIEDYNINRLLDIENQEPALIIGFDSLGSILNISKRKNKKNEDVEIQEEVILQKPRTKDEAYARLKQLSGKEHAFYTSVYLINQVNGAACFFTEKTEAIMAELSTKEIETYLEFEKGFMNYSLGYNPAVFYYPEKAREVWNDSKARITSVSGDLDNLILGTPLKTLNNRIKQIMK